MVKNLKDLMIKFADETVCREYLIKQRWPDGKIICQYCGHDHCYRIEKGERFKCANNKCYKRFRVTVGTIFEASNIPLNKWFPAMYLILSHKKGISSIQLGKDLGVTQKTAWFMLHRIREQLKANDSPMLSGTCEIDEVYIGGKVGNMSKSKRAKLREEGNTYNTKTMVMGMIQREGDLRFVTIGKPTQSAKLLPAIKQNIDTNSQLITDSLPVYEELKKDYAGHEVVNHSDNEYVRNSVIHTNSIEGAFSLLKRSIYGIYHQVTPKHLSRYCDETMFRYNTRKIKDGERFTFTLQNIEGRLTYKQLISAENPLTIEAPFAEIVSVSNLNPKVKGRPVHQINQETGEVINTFQTIKEAGEKTGLKWQSISRVLRGKRYSTGGYIWKYA